MQNNNADFVKITFFFQDFKVVFLKQLNFEISLRPDSTTKLLQTRIQTKLNSLLCQKVKILSQKNNFKFFAGIFACLKSLLGN